MPVPMPTPMLMLVLVLVVSGTRRKGWKESWQLEFSQAMVGLLLWQQQTTCNGKS